MTKDDKGGFFDSPSSYDTHSADKGSFYGSGLGAAASSESLAALSLNPELDPTQLRIIEADATDIVLRGGSSADLAAKHPQISRNLIEAQFDAAETRNNWNPMESQAKSFGHSQSEEKSEGQGLAAIPGWISKLTTRARSAVDSGVEAVKRTLGIDTDDPKVRYAEDMGVANGPNMDRMMTQGRSLNAGLPNQGVRGRGQDAELGRA